MNFEIIISLAPSFLPVETRPESSLPLDHPQPRTYLARVDFQVQTCSPFGERKVVHVLCSTKLPTRLLFNSASSQPSIGPFVAPALTSLKIKGKIITSNQI